MSEALDDGQAAADAIRQIADRRWDFYQTQLSTAGLTEKLDLRTLRFMRAAFTQGVAHAFDEMENSIDGRRA
jgi:hypothetical protein